MPITTISLTGGSRWRGTGGGWFPSGGVVSGTRYQWAHSIHPSTGVSTYFYDMSVRSVDMADALPLRAVVTSATLHAEGTAHVSVTFSGSTLVALSSCPDFLVEMIGTPSGTSADYDGVYGASVGQWSWTHDGGNLNTYTMDGTSTPFDIGLLTGVLSFRAGFDAGQTPSSFTDGIGGPGIGEATLTGVSISVWIEIEYECIEPDGYENAVPCEDAYILDVMSFNQIEASDTTHIYKMTYSGAVAQNDGSRILMWFDTCQLTSLFESITSVYLKFSIEWLERYACNPYLYGYYAQAYHSITNELQPVGDESGADYILTEYTTAFDPIEHWAIGKGLMTLDYEDDDVSYYAGPNQMIVELDNIVAVNGRVTGIVLVGDYGLGEGYMDILDTPQLLICGVPNDQDEDGTPDPSDPDPTDPDNPTPQEPEEPDTPARPETPDRRERRGQLPTDTRGEYPLPFEQPSPNRMEAMRRFLLRLKRDGD